jgi:hypothetical protein
VKTKHGNADKETNESPYQDSKNNGERKGEVEMEIGNRCRIGADGEKCPLSEREKAGKACHQIGAENEDGIKAGDLKNL